MELEREEGVLLIRWHRGRVALGVLTIMGALFCLVGIMSLLTGQHLPQLSSVMTCVWALLVGIPGFLWGLCFIGYKRELTFSAEGIDAYFSRWRFIEWRLRFGPKRLDAIFIEPQRSMDYSRVMLQINGKNQADLEIARNLPNEEAWRLASLIAEVTALPIRGA